MKARKDPIAAALMIGLFVAPLLLHFVARFL
jgi:hypothetical protein